MDQVLWFVAVEWTGDLKTDVKALFEANGLLDVYKHTKRSVKKGRKLALRSELNENSLDAALYLHDIGRIVPKDKVLDFLKTYECVVTEEEVNYPGILHQKVSAVIAEYFFGLTDKTALEAIKCHTTMKPNPNQVEKLVFLSDKLSWKDKSERDLVLQMKKASKKSVDKAIFIYLDAQYIKRDSLRYYHEQSRQAYVDFKFRVHKIYSVKRIKPTAKKEAL